MKHIIALSGGKDSTAMALMLNEREPREYIYLCTPTGDELPEMQCHWDVLSRLLKSPILQIGPGFTFTELIYREEMIPNFRARFCTRILKIEPTEEFLSEIGEATLYVGLRADEPERVGGIYDAKQRFPLREWGVDIDNVLSYLSSRGVSIPVRTDCAMCFWQRIGEWWDLWYFYPDPFAKAEKIESDLGHTFRTPGKDTWATGLAGLRGEFEKGRTPRNARKQMNLFGDQQRCRVCTL